MTVRSYLLLSVAALAGAARAAEPAVQTVQVAASRLEQRRLDTGATIVVGRDELLRQGERSLSDTLKRLPGISVAGAQGRAGDIRMRGLGNGYTQVLLNGVSVPAGFSLDSLAPDLIERVEILRVATAETGAQAIAGTINIVLRKSVARGQNELKLGMDDSADKRAPALTVLWSGKHERYAYTVTGATQLRRHGYDSMDEDLETDADGVPTLARSTRERERTTNRVTSIAPRISWTLDNGDTLAWQSLLSHSNIGNQSDTSERVAVGALSTYPVSDRHFVASGNRTRSDLQWNRQLPDGAGLEFKSGVNDLHSGSLFEFNGRDPAGRLALQRLVHAPVTERSYTLGLKLSLKPADAHALTLGWDGGRSVRREARFERELPATGEPTDERNGATVRRLAVFAQDEWTITPVWSVSAGLRWEALATAAYAVRQDWRVLSPLLQTLYKQSATRQWRLGVSRTYKAPTMANLIPRRFTVDNNNNPNNPDTQGNPGLRPEVAWGLDAAYEHYVGQGGMLGASVYARRIDDVMVRQLFQKGTTWIETPANLGSASTGGVELEAKLPLIAAGLDLRANLARNWSRIARVPGPDNRIDQQTPVSASVGLDYRLPSLPLTLGASLTFQNGGPARLSAYRTVHAGVKRELDLYALWRPAPRTQLRVAIGNALHQTYQSGSRYTDQSGTVGNSTGARSFATLRMNLEHKFGL
jgi:outer membrane receptor protein involved in Fe transport